MVTYIVAYNWLGDAEGSFPAGSPKEQQNIISQPPTQLTKGCRSRESNTGLVHGKHEFYH